MFHPPAHRPRLQPLARPGRVGALLLSLGACSRGSDKAAHSGTDDTARSRCTPPEAVDPAALPETFENAQGSRYRVVKVKSDSFESLGAVVFLPDAGVMFWEEGSPVVVTVPPALNVNLRWGDNPTSYLSPSSGIIEVQPVFPGWTVRDVETEGPADGAGPRSALAVAEVSRFVRGELTTEKGWSFPALLESDACLDRLGLLSISSGALALAAALTDTDTLLGEAAVVGFYEPPSLPAFVTSEGGAIWMDPDEGVDGDGDGVVWDDGRNLSFDGDGCSGSGCPSDLSTLAYTSRVSISDLWPADAAMQMPRGVFFLDRNGNGELDLSDDTHPDTNGDGVIGAEEDFFPKPVYDDFTDEDGIDLIYSPELLAVAVDRVPPEDWPVGFRRLEEVTEYWAAREVASRMAELASRWPLERPIGVFYTEVPHGAAIPSRPDSRIVYDALRDAGVAVRYNAPIGVASCLLGEEGLAGYPGAPEVSAAVGDLAPWAFPEAWATDSVHTVSMAGLFAAAFGDPDACL